MEGALPPRSAAARHERGGSRRRSLPRGRARLPGAVDPGRPGADPRLPLRAGRRGRRRHRGRAHRAPRHPPPRRIRLAGPGHAGRADHGAPPGPPQGDPSSRRPRRRLGGHLRRGAARTGAGGSRRAPAGVPPRRPRATDPACGAPARDSRRLRVRSRPHPPAGHFPRRRRPRARARTRHGSRRPPVRALRPRPRGGVPLALPPRHGHAVHPGRRTPHGRAQGCRSERRAGLHGAVRPHFLAVGDPPRGGRHPRRRRRRPWVSGDRRRRLDGVAARGVHARARAGGHAPRHPSTAAAGGALPRDVRAGPPHLDREARPRRLALPLGEGPRGGRPCRRRRRGAPPGRSGRRDPHPGGVRAGAGCPVGGRPRRDVPGGLARREDPHRGARRRTRHP